MTSRITAKNLITFHFYPLFIDFCEIWLNVSFFQELITGEGLRLAADKMDSKNFYAINPAFDMKKPNKRR